MLRRLFVRSRRRELTSSRQPAHQSRQRLRSGAAISALALIAAALGTATLPAPPAEAIHGNPSGGSGKFVQVIDWIDWTEMTNTVAGRGAAILPDGSTGVVWSTPTQISGNMWRTSRCTVSNVRTTAVGRKESVDPTLFSLQQWSARWTRCNDWCATYCRRPVSESTRPRRCFHQEGWSRLCPPRCWSSRSSRSSRSPD